MKGKNRIHTRILGIVSGIFAFVMIPISDKCLQVGAAMLFFVAFAFLWQKLFQRCRHAWYLSSAKRVYRRLHDIVGENAPARRMAYLRHINPYVFEELLLLAYSKKGHRIVRNIRYSGDGGVDGWVYFGREKIPVQAKRYRSHIRRKHVEAFSMLVSKVKAPYGLFIHTGRTGRGSSGKEFPNVRIISGDKLLQLLDSGKQQPDNIKK